MCETHDGKRYYSPEIDRDMMKYRVPIAIRLSISDADQGCQPRIEHEHRIRLHLDAYEYLDAELSLEFVSKYKKFIGEILSNRTFRWLNTETHRYEFMAQVFNLEQLFTPLPLDNRFLTLA